MAFDSTTQEKFRNAFEQNCFKLLIDAYQLSLTEKVIQLDWNENDISQELAEKIDANPKRKKWRISVSREFHLPKNDIVKKKGFADKLPRIDFKMSQFSKKDECLYYCEAKRLKQSDSGLKRAYINEGMERFISNKYPSGCMLGYLVEGKTEKTITGINSLLEKDNRIPESLIPILHKLHSSYFESKHIRSLIIKHLIFEFT